MTRLGLYYAQKQVITNNQNCWRETIAKIYLKGMTMFDNAWNGKWQGGSPIGDHHQRSRKIVRHTGITIRGKFPSRKNGRMVHHESLLELDAIYLFETFHRIREYREQPARINYSLDEKSCRYTPDFEVLLDTGETKIVEIKPKIVLEQNDIRKKLDRIKTHYQNNGLDFIVVTDSDIRIEPRLSNLKWIYSQLPRIWPTYEALQVASETLSRHFPMPLRLATSLLTKTNINIFSLFVSGHISIDLDKPINSETILKLRKEWKNEDIWFAEKYGF